MRRPSSKQRRLVSLLLAILTFGVAYYGGNKYSGDDLPQISGTLLRPAMPAPEFELKDQAGRHFSEKQLKDHWSLILLDPNQVTDSPALPRLVRIHNRLASDPTLQQQTHFIYLPQQTSEAADAVAAGLGTGFYALSGNLEDLRETFSRFGVSEINHGFTLYLIDPESRMQALFTSSQDAANIAEDLKTLITHYH